MAAGLHSCARWLVSLLCLTGCSGLFEPNPLFEGTGTGTGGDGDGDGPGDGDGENPGDGDGDGDSQGDGDGDGDLPAPEGMVGDSPTSMWIDVTEVSVASYQEFLDAGVTVPPAISRCAWKQSHEPDEWLAQASVDKPVVGVDWCDAYAYCEWAGKRLCHGNPDNPLDAVSSKNEWFWACSNRLDTNFPYGGDYLAQACNGEEKGFGETLDVGSLSTCEGGFSGLFDMSGNVWEWIDACDLVDDGDAEFEQCARRGGSYFSGSNGLECDAQNSDLPARREKWIGFRCCADPV